VGGNLAFFFLLVLFFFFFRSGIFGLEHNPPHARAHSASHMGSSSRSSVLELIVLVFYAGHILDDKNTLCNGCYLNRIIGLIQNLEVIWTVFISSHVPCEFLKDVFMKIPCKFQVS
jgi:hypothetical protein